MQKDRSDQEWNRDKSQGRKWDRIFGGFWIGNLIQFLTEWSVAKGLGNVCTCLLHIRFSKCYFYDFIIGAKYVYLQIQFCMYSSGKISN